MDGESVALWPEWERKWEVQIFIVIRYIWCKIAGYRVIGIGIDIYESVSSGLTLCPFYNYRNNYMCKVTED